MDVMGFIAGENPDVSHFLKPIHSYKTQKGQNEQPD
jgi:hypothetical protein